MPLLTCAKVVTAPGHLATRVGHVRASSTRRLSSAAVTPPPRHERIVVPCRSNGAINIDIFRSSASSSPIIVYLPPGPVVPANETSEQDVISTLCESSAATIARIQYRASSEYPYPTPFHDALFGLDWIKENLLLDEFQRPYLARLGICGELMGGSIATMLALTECRHGESRISAAAVNNPIVDWVFPDELPSDDLENLPEPLAGDETAFPADGDMGGSISLSNELQKPERKRKKRKPKQPHPTSWQSHGQNATLSSQTLASERDALFRKPQDYLDRFASPIHFFRSPHVQLIFPQHEDLLASQQPDQNYDAETLMALDHYSSFNSESKSAIQELPTLARCRAYARNYPPAGTRLNLPVWAITTGIHSPLSDQATELTKVLRRSLARHTLKNQSGRSKWFDANEKNYYEEFAEERVELRKQPGIGLWTSPSDNPHWKEHVEEMGEWMKHRLAPEFT